MSNDQCGDKIAILLKLEAIILWTLCIRLDVQNGIGLHAYGSQVKLGQVRKLIDTLSEFINIRKPTLFAYASNDQCGYKKAIF